MGEVKVSKHLRGYMSLFQTGAPTMALIRRRMRHDVQIRIVPGVDIVSSSLSGHFLEGDHPLVNVAQALLVATDAFDDVESALRRLESTPVVDDIAPKSTFWRTSAWELVGTDPVPAQDQSDHATAKMQMKETNFVDAVESLWNGPKKCSFNGAALPAMNIIAITDSVTLENAQKAMCKQHSMIDIPLVDLNQLRTGVWDAFVKGFEENARKEEANKELPGNVWSKAFADILVRVLKERNLANLWRLGQITTIVSINSPRHESQLIRHMFSEVWRPPPAESDTEMIDIVFRSTNASDPQCHKWLETEDGQKRAYLSRILLERTPREMPPMPQKFDTPKDWYTHRVKYTDGGVENTPVTHSQLNIPKQYGTSVCYVAIDVTSARDTNWVQSVINEYPNVTTLCIFCRSGDSQITEINLFQTRIETLICYNLKTLKHIRNMGQLRTLRLRGVDSANFIPEHWAPNSTHTVDVDNELLCQKLVCGTAPTNSSSTIYFSYTVGSNTTHGIANQNPDEPLVSEQFTLEKAQVATSGGWFANGSLADVACFEASEKPVHRFIGDSRTMLHMMICNFVFGIPIVVQPDTEAVYENRDPEPICTATHWKALQQHIKDGFRPPSREVNLNNWLHTQYDEVLPNERRFYVFQVPIKLSLPLDKETDDLSDEFAKSSSHSSGLRRKSSFMSEGSMGLSPMSSPGFSPGFAHGFS